MPGPPQSRLGDTHLCTVPPAFPSPIMAVPMGPPVLVNKLVAAKVTDPTMSGPLPPAPPIPHVMLKGSFTVLINKKPAVRIGDLCALGGPVALGSFNVFTGG